LVSAAGVGPEQFVQRKHGVSEATFPKLTNKKLAPSPRPP
jgi:hypothetical protein